MLSITADTNTYISGLNFGGEPRRFLNMAESGLFRLSLSDHILAELRRVLAYPKIGWPEERIEQALRQLRRYTEHVTPQERVSVITADLSDNGILECAIAAKSDYLVSGDKHLRDLGQYGNIRIVKLSEMMSLLESGSVTPGAHH